MASDPIPLQDLSRPHDQLRDEHHNGSLSPNPSRSRSLLRGGNLGAEIGRRISTHRARRSYDRVREDSPPLFPPPLAPAIPDLQVPEYGDVPQSGIPTLIDVRQGLAEAFGADGGRGSWLPSRGQNEPFSPWVADEDDDPPRTFPSFEISREDDMAHLTDPSNMQGISGFTHRKNTHRKNLSNHSVKFAPGSSLGEDLHSAVEEGLGGGGTRSRSGSTATRSGSLSKGRSLSPGASPVRRVSVAVQNMAQRVVNVSNDPDTVEQTMRRRSSSKSHQDRPRRPSVPAIEIHTLDDTEPSDAEEKPTTPLRRVHRPDDHLWHRQSNPLRGNTMRIFSPENPLRLFLCDILIHPLAESFILVLILIQTILLTIDAAPSVYEDPRAKKWGTSNIDYALLVLFIIYTLEIVARCIVSGVFLNPHRENDPRGRGNLRRRIAKKSHRLFSPKRSESVRAPSPRPDEPPSLLRAITSNLQFDGDKPRTIQDQARSRMARRAFLRHSFNRLDFVAVVSYWISLYLCITGMEAERHLYVFRMMSCLRILRLLGITSGTSVILRSLKKAAPLLVNVALLIGFFWLIFAIIGVQSFKSSLRRTCVWVDPEGLQANYTQAFQFCGGYFNATTGRPLPYLFLDGTPGAKRAKGYICPVNSLCVADQNPYGGTVSFDNIIQSLELVFVVMTANTFSDLLYYMADSDYLAAALFFAFGIVILAFWLCNLLIAVITTSFQVIREESRKSAFAAEDDDEIKKGEAFKQLKKTSFFRRAYDRTRYLWILVIAGGIFAQTFRSSSMSIGREELIDRVELCVTITLLVEIIFRFSSDWRVFWKSKQNWTDLFLVLITCVLQLPRIHNSGRVYEWLTLFQILRVYRVVWAIPIIRDLLAKVIGNVSGLSNLIFFVLLLTYLCALFAVQIVRGDIPQEYGGETTPISFNTIFNAFLGMYEIFSSENWTGILYMATDVQAQYNVGWITAIFFIAWFILGNFIVLNMFIAVVQENFDVTEDEKREKQLQTFLENKDYSAPTKGISLASIFGIKEKRKDRSRQAVYGMLTKQVVVEQFLDEGAAHPRQALTRAAPLDFAIAVGKVNAEEVKKTGLFQKLRTKFDIFSEKEPNPFYKFQSAIAGLAPTAIAEEVLTEADRRKRAQREYLKKYPNYNVSLFIFRPSNPLRRLCQRMVGPSRGDVRHDGLPPYTHFSYAFSIVVYCAIVAMVIIACVTTPLYQKQYFETHGSSLRNWFTYSDLGFVTLFTLESAIKIIADGLIWTPNAYLRGSWGVIDCVVLITLWVSVSTSLQDKGDIARSVGAFKALRALRLLNISGSAQDTFHSVVILGGKKIVSAAFVSLSLIIPFAIYGVNLFAGLMDSCNDGSAEILNLTDCVHEYASTPFEWDVLAPRAVDNPYFNFDNFGSSLFILFQIVSQEGWTGVMFSAQSIVGKGQQPQPFASDVNSLFFLAFNLLGAVFVLTLFVSVFMRNYTEQTGVAFLTSEQRSWLELRKLLRQVRPSRRPISSPSSSLRSWCYKRATHKHGWWQRALTVVLILHGVLLLIEYHPAPSALDRVRDWMFLGFTAIFVVNLGVRVLGLTWNNFLKSNWDLYALLSVSGTSITTVLLLAGYDERTFIQLQKLFLVSILMMLIPRNDDLDHLFKTAAASLTSIGSLMATWFVLFLVYAIALTQTFGLTKIGSNGNGNMNFRTVPKALILLFRMTCGEGWNQIMSDYEVSPPMCVHGESFYQSDCGSQGFARALFVSWNILSMYIFVSMFISLIFESFSYVYQRSGDSSAVSRTEIRNFKEAWQKFDPEGTGYISKEKFPRLLGILTGVFAMRIYEEPFTIQEILKDVRVDPMRPDEGVSRVIEGIDLDALNRRISMLPKQRVQKQRQIFTLFYEECLVSADKDYGVAFTSVLLILAHYKIINDNKSLRLEEYLRRRYRLQRVEEQIQRNCVVNFFLTLYWAKRFKDQKAPDVDSLTYTLRGSSRVPEIYVDDGSSHRETIPLVPRILVDDQDIPPDLNISQMAPTEVPSTPKRRVPLSLDLGGPSDLDMLPSSFGSSIGIFGDTDPFATSHLEESPSLRQTFRKVGAFDLSPSGSPTASRSASPAMSPTASPPSDRQLGVSRGRSVGGGDLRQPQGGQEISPDVVQVLDSSGLEDRIRSYIESRSRSQSPTNHGNARSYH